SVADVAELRRRGRNFLSCGNVARGCILAKLQRADVSGDAPSIARRNLRAIFRHRAVAIGHDVKEVSNRYFAQTLDVIRRRTLESARRNEAIAIADASVTRRAVNVETLASAGKNFGGRRERQIVAGGAADPSRVEVSVFVEIAACHRALDRQAGGPIVR